MFLSCFFLFGCFESEIKCDVDDDDEAIAIAAAAAVTAGAVVDN